MNTEVYYDILHRAVQKGEQLVQATVIATRGSCPAEPGTKALFGSSGLLAGTTGGGALELVTGKIAREILNSGMKAKFEHFELGSDLGMVCGGSADVFFENLSTRNWRVVVFGAGHVAAALIDCLKSLTVDIICVDHRQEWLDRLPVGDNVCPVLVENYPDYVQELRGDDFVLIMTPGHKFDFSVVCAVLDTRQLPYLACIGSKRKAIEMRTELAGSYTVDQLNTVICPAGLSFGTNAPEEIAISIIAQMLMVRDEKSV